MTREEMIQLLVLNGLERQGSLRGTLWLQRLLEHGFRGYANLTDKELAAEMRARGLDCDLEDEDDASPGQDEAADLDFLLHRRPEEFLDS